LIAAIAACRAGAFTCSDDDQCRAGETMGVCQPAGVCSFPDDACDSGQRFGDHSGELSGRCVPPGGTESTSTAVAETSSVETIDPSIAEVSSTSLPADTSSSGGAASSSEGEASSSTGEPIDPNLLIWLKFDDDLSDGLANDGAIGGVATCENAGCPTAVEGAIGQAGSFDAIDDCGLIESTPALDVGEFTLALWARREMTMPGFEGAFTKPVGGSPYNTWRMTLQVDEMGVDVLNVHVGTSDDSGVDSYAPLPLGMWTHFAATYDGMTMTSYLDGQLFESLPNALIEIDDSPVYVGCDNDNAGPLFFLSGALDDVRMYDRVLAADEIAELHALGSP
jgi:hypothetical protein